MLAYLIPTIIIARLIAQEEWGYLILATSYITIAGIILLFLPPSFGNSMNYYIPKYRVTERVTKLKSFISKAYSIRLLSVLSVFFLSYIIFFNFLDLFRVSLNQYAHLLLIIAPLIITSNLDENFNEIYRGFNKFEYVFITTMFKAFLTIGALIYFFFFATEVSVETIAYINLYTAVLPFVVNVIIAFVFLRFRFRNKDHEKIKLKIVLKELFTYGLVVSGKNSIVSVTQEAKTQLLGIYANAKWVTGYNIGLNIKKVPNQSASVLFQPLIISFSKLYTEKDFDQITKIYRYINKIVVIIELLIGGLTLFLIAPFLYFLYGESYLIYTVFIQLFILSTLWAPQSSLVISLLKVSDKLKYLIPIAILFTAVRLPLFLIFIFFFGAIGAVWSILISSIIVFLISLYLPLKLFDIKVDYMKILIQYVFFFIALGISLLLDALFFHEFYLTLLNNLNLSFVRYFPVFAILIFYSIFSFLIIIGRIINHSDIKYLEAFFDQNTFLHKYIRKVLRLTRIFVRR